MRHALVFGATGQIGAPLIDLLHRDGWRVTAVSRGEQRDRPGLHWLEGTLPAFDAALPREVEAKVRGVPGVSGVRLDLVFDPPWTKNMMSDAAKLQLARHNDELENLRQRAAAEIENEELKI